MTDWRQKTIDTYNASAESLAAYFKGIGPRTKYIDIAFNLLDANIKNPLVVEIGCGDGRDATDIVTRTNRYQGFDISEGMIAIACKTAPGVTFSVSDAMTYEYPENIDIVFAFASVLHLNKDELAILFKTLAQKLNKGGIFYISTKYKPHYEHSVKTDAYGDRMFYFYDKATLQSLAGNQFMIEHNDIEHFGSTDWLEIAFKRV